MIKVLEQKLATAQSKFNQLNEQRKRLSEQRANLDRQIAGLAEEQVRLQGDFRALNGLIEEERSKAEAGKKTKEKK